VPWVPCAPAVGAVVCLAQCPLLQPAVPVAVGAVAGCCSAGAVLLHCALCALRATVPGAQVPQHPQVPARPMQQPQGPPQASPFLVSSPSSLARDASPSFFASALVGLFVCQKENCASQAAALQTQSVLKLLCNRDCAATLLDTYRRQGPICNAAHHSGRLKEAQPRPTTTAPRRRAIPHLEPFSMHLSQVLGRACLFKLIVSPMS
jgi:hypothetical protein